MSEFRIELTFACPFKDESACPLVESQVQVKKDCQEKMKAIFDLEHGWSALQPCGLEARLEDLLEALVERFKCWEEKKMQEEE